MGTNNEDKKKPFYFGGISIIEFDDSEELEFDNELFDIYNLQASAV